MVGSTAHMAHRQQLGRARADYGLPGGLGKTGAAQRRFEAVASRCSAVPSSCGGVGVRALARRRLLAVASSSSSSPSFLCFLFPSSLLAAADGTGRNSPWLGFWGRQIGAYIEVLGLQGGTDAEDCRSGRGVRVRTRGVHRAVQHLGFGGALGQGGVCGSRRVPRRGGEAVGGLHRDAGDAR